MTPISPGALHERFDQPPSPAAQEVLQVLRVAVAQALERKRRLGQYAVVWQGGQVQALPSEVLPPWPVEAGERAVASSRYPEAVPAPALTVEEPRAGGSPESTTPPLPSINR